MEMEITWGRTVRIWWAYFWRNILAIIAAMIAGGVVGFIVGFAMGLVGMPVGAIQVVATLLGLAAGLAFSIVPMKMILGKDFGEFRLVLVSNAKAG